MGYVHALSCEFAVEGSAALVGPQTAVAEGGIKPSLAAQGVEGSVTNALAAAFLGSLGGGKSFCNNLIIYYSVLFGGHAVIIDPKSGAKRSYLKRVGTALH